MAYVTSPVAPTNTRHHKVYATTLGSPPAQPLDLTAPNGAEDFAGPLPQHNTIAWTIIKPAWCSEYYLELYEMVGSNIRKVDLAAGDGGPYTGNGYIEQTIVPGRLFALRLVDIQATDDSSHPVAGDAAFTVIWQGVNR